MTNQVTGVSVLAQHETAKEILNSAVKSGSLIVCIDVRSPVTQITQRVRLFLWRQLQIQMFSNNAAVNR